MSLNIKNLSNRQRRVLTLLCEGLSPGAVAEATDYSQSHVSRIARSEAGRAALLELRSELEAQLVSELPSLVSEALTVLRAQLSSPIGPQRTAAAQFVLKNLAKPWIQGIAKDAGKDIDTTGVIGETINHESEKGIFNHGLEAENHENSTNP